MDLPVCHLCDEVIEDPDPDTDFAHRECLLREVAGGIGHIIAHDYWCLMRHDPDAGYTYRQSALMVDAIVHSMGVTIISENRANPASSPSPHPPETPGPPPSR